MMFAPKKYHPIDKSGGGMKLFGNFVCADHLKSGTSLQDDHLAIFPQDIDSTFGRHRRGEHGHFSGSPFACEAP